MSCQIDDIACTEENATFEAKILNYKFKGLQSLEIDLPPDGANFVLLSFAGDPVMLCLRLTREKWGIIPSFPRAPDSITPLMGYFNHAAPWLEATRERERGS